MTAPADDGGIGPEKDDPVPRRVGAATPAPIKPKRSFTLLLVLAPLGILALLSGWGVLVAFKMSAGAPMSVHGYVAMGLACGLTAVLGVGLMGLAFYSSKHGYDDNQGS